MICGLFPFPTHQSITNNLNKNENQKVNRFIGEPWFTGYVVSICKPCTYIIFFDLIWISLNGLFGAVHQDESFKCKTLKIEL